METALVTVLPAMAPRSRQRAFRRLSDTEIEQEVAVPLSIRVARGHVKWARGRWLSEAARDAVHRK